MTWQVYFGSGPITVRVYAIADTEAQAVDNAVRLTLETEEPLYGWVAEQKGRGRVVVVNITPVHQRVKEEITAKYGKTGQYRDTDKPQGYVDPPDAAK